MFHADGVEGVCAARTRSAGGSPCRRPAGWGTDHPGSGRCKLHGGATPAASIRAARIAAQARVAAVGGATEIEPSEALLWSLHLSAGQVEFLLRELETDLPKQERSAMLALYDAERDRLARVAKSCIDANVDERRVRLAEAQARQLASAFAAAMEDVARHLNPAAREALRFAFSQRLRDLAQKEPLALGAHPDWNERRPISSLL